MLFSHIAPRLSPPDNNEVHIWRIEADETNTAVLSAHLSEAELAHATRFHSLISEREFRAARGFIRFLLGHYLAISPTAIRLVRGAHGKPQLSEVLGGGTPSFNVSHCRGVVLAAVAVDQQVGIDIEFIQSQINFSEIAPLVFSTADQVWLAQSSCDQRRSFFECWTRKEAFLKARGDGLSDGMAQFAIVPSDRNHALRVVGVPDADQWMVSDLDVGASFAAAIAVDSPNCKFRMCDWSANRS